MTSTKYVSSLYTNVSAVKRVFNPLCVDVSSENHVSSCRRDSR